MSGPVSMFRLMVRLDFFRATISVRSSFSQWEPAMCGFQTHVFNTARPESSLPLSYTAISNRKVVIHRFADFVLQGVSVEAVDPVFQAKMLDMLKQTGRPEMVVGWYHSHPGFGCWLSGVDINTQQSFEALSDRAVAVVVDPIQSVKGKVTDSSHRST